jgi:hypothetical protein
MEKAELITYYPQLFHMGESFSRPMISKYGLRPTSALLDFFESKGEKSQQLEIEYRPEKATIEHHAFGTAVLRDRNQCLSPNMARACSG